MPTRKPPHALVVGGTRGIGHAVASMFARQGYVVSVIGRTAPKPSAERKIRFFPGDLAQTDSLPALASQIVAVRGPLQSLVFLQRFRGGGDPWNLELQVSLTATRIIIESTQRGFGPGPNSIVVVGSIASQLVAEEQSAGYHAVKGALRQLVRYYACALGPSGIRVNSVSPGVILKPEAREFYAANPKLVQLYERIAPLRRFGTAAEVAGVVKFLCSGDAAFVTGQDIVVDGGISMVWQASLARALIPIKVRQPGASRTRRQV
jgi:NAD(P)-dependent dehydrogenase (short-subunit alcohol dehydrogenase family)